MENADQRKKGSKLVKNIDHLLKLEDKRKVLYKQLAFHGALMVANVDPSNVKHVLPLLEKRTRIEEGVFPNNYEIKRVFLKGEIKDIWDLYKFKFIIKNGILGGVILKDGTVIDFETPISDCVEYRKWPDTR